LRNLLPASAGLFPLPPVDFRVLGSDELKEGDGEGISSRIRSFPGGGLFDDAISYNQSRFLKRSFPAISLLCVFMPSMPLLLLRPI
jgi:hypothetical protein